MTKIISILSIACLLFAGGNFHFGQREKEFSVEKIIFHSAGCYGICPTYHLEIDSNRKLKLDAERVYAGNQKDLFALDSNKMGYFTGIVPDSTYSKLLNQLNNLGLDTFEVNGSNCCDGSFRTIIVYYNGKRKVLQSMFPPRKLAKVFTALNDICQDSALVRSQNKFDIEMPSPLSEETEPNQQLR